MKMEIEWNRETQTIYEIIDMGLKQMVRDGWLSIKDHKKIINIMEKKILREMKK